ncbi:uncharacterized protein EI90DRAFT_3131202 [Cantharellus anzutake]|uniref:uncharacterized protein n=1 Tax=Cantharellus anzutake TaxID=1750568 RepID=UPI001908D981|nr:uncharacterized protein EI90DRAFT_3140081 [Cantharellus anzutake]XP_038910835.1 uncharacterized protein EI90DRAFT_3131202 [Cantharellus anzutake]KAF8309949.1 hypothetical protein EI90DRAFT_3140081 [Cantharellus anzutake]KAF8322336.1 hypothetical protein EI90DRAFT_3131202 [Cantharellus anzutake]
MPPRDFPSARSEIRDPQDNQQWHSTPPESLRLRSFHTKSPIPFRSRPNPPILTICDDVVVQEPIKDPVPKPRPGPAYHYASELQDRMRGEELFTKLMTQEVNVPLGAIIGSSYELNKRLQAATKIHRVPTKPVSSVEMVEDSKMEGEVMEAEIVPAPFEVASLENVESEDEEGDILDGNTVEEQADKFYQELLKSDCMGEYDVDCPPSFLAMVTAKIQGMIFCRPCTMLIDTGSELNIMTSKHARLSELPVDPSGASWSLRGVSRHQIALEGLCREVPVTIGGIEVPHNFFIT